MSEIAPPGQSVMLGGGFYSHNSRPQRAAASAADAHLVAAAAAVPLPGPPAPVLIGDFGCAGGANELAPLAAAVDELRARDASLPIEVAHTDLPQNDFGPLFALLQGPGSYLTGVSAIYPYVVGRTLYGPLFPDRRLHLGWSAITLHWLSSMPVTVPGRVYSNLVEDGPARDSVAERAAADWRTFLTERARELVDGGELVLTGGASLPDGRSGAEGLFVMIQDVLAGMVDDGGPAARRVRPHLLPDLEPHAGGVGRTGRGARLRPARRGVHRHRRRRELPRVARARHVRRRLPAVRAGHHASGRSSAGSTATARPTTARG